MTGALIENLLAEAREKYGEYDTPGGINHWQGLDVGIAHFVRRLSKQFDCDSAYRDELADAISALGDDGKPNVVAQINASFDRGISKCESPIERLIFPWLLAQKYPGFVHNPIVLFPGESPLLEDQCVAIVPQLPVGRYRVDFAVAARRGPYLKLLIVECDGAAYHDNVEQVKRDVDRDVTLAANPQILDVVRFSGTAIFRSPRGCANAVADRLLDCWRKDNKELLHKFEPKAG